MQQKIFIGVISKGSRLLCLSSPKPTVLAGRTRQGTALAQQAKAGSPAPFSLHPACLPFATEAAGASLTCSWEATGSPGTTMSNTCKCGLRPKLRETELVFGASGDLVRRGRGCGGSRLNGTHRTARKVGKHLPSRRWWKVKPEGGRSGERPCVATRAPVTVPVRLGCGAVTEDGIQVSSTVREQNKLLTLIPSEAVWGKAHLCLPLLASLQMQYFQKQAGEGYKRRVLAYKGLFPTSHCSPGVGFKCLKS